MTDWLTDELIDWLTSDVDQNDYFNLDFSCTLIFFDNQSVTAPYSQQLRANSKQAMSNSVYKAF